MDQLDLKDTIIDLLVGTEREGIHELINYLIDSGYFESPASTKYHGSHPGGLAEHSHNVLIYFTRLSREIGLDLPKGSNIIPPLLHDVCKIGKYIPKNGGYEWNKSGTQGHGTLSVERIKQFIDLTELEEQMILYHMGMYECHDGIFCNGKAKTE